jgi:hypothetical protein
LPDPATPTPITSPPALPICIPPSFSNRVTGDN